MKHVSAALLSGMVALSCAPAVVVTPEPAVVVAAPTATVAMTPVSRHGDGMVVAHANLSGWGPPPAAVPAGAQLIILEGDPSKAQLFTLRFRLPHNYLVPPHSHPAWEHVTVISGIVHIGTGDRVNMSSASELRAGSFIALPAGMNHFVHAVGETVIQIHGMGPFDLRYVNASDDPRNR